MKVYLIIMNTNG